MEEDVDRGGRAFGWKNVEPFGCLRPIGDVGLDGKFGARRGAPRLPSREDLLVARKPLVIVVLPIQFRPVVAAVDGGPLISGASSMMSGSMDNKFTSRTPGDPAIIVVDLQTGKSRACCNF